MDDDGIVKSFLRNAERGSTFPERSIAEHQQAKEMVEASADFDSTMVVRWI